jgi:hypothetical protein
MARRISEELRGVDPMLPEQAAALKLGWDELHRMLDVLARGMQFGCHPGGEMFASVAAMVSHVVRSLKPCDQAR